MRKLTYLLPFLFSMPVLGQLDAKYGEISILPSQQKNNFSIHPDNTCIQLANVGMRWRNKVGVTIPLLRYELKEHEFMAQTSGFIELHDISQRQLMSWQLWRGNLGLDFYYYPHLRNKKHNLGIGLLLHHESQHVTDLYSFAIEFLGNSLLFDNASARSFEYRALEVQHEFTEGNITFTNRAMARFFPQPFLLTATRQQMSSYSFETGVRYTVTKQKNVAVYLNYYYEYIKNQFEAASSYYKVSWNKQPFTYSIAEAGVWLKSKTGVRSANLYITWYKGNGRGLDFVKTYNDWGLGLRFNL